MKAVGLALISLWVAAVPVKAQVEPVVPPPAPEPERFEIVVDPSTATVGFAVHIPGGSASDPAGMEGTAAVLATTVQEALDQQMASLAARADVHVQRGGLTIRGRSAPDAIIGVLDVIRRAIFEAPLPLVHLEQTRASLLSRLRFEVGAPVRAFEDRLGATVFATIPGWSQPVLGTLASVEAIDLEALARNAPFDASARREVTAAVVGPVDSADVAAALRSLVGPGARLESPTRRGMAWRQGARDEVQIEITSSWVAVGLPVDSSVPIWKVELLAHHISEVLEPDPPRPGIISPRVEVHTPEGMPVILVSFAITPERAHLWVDRILTTARLQSDAPPDERFFRWQRRRFRTVWLSERASPEARAERLVRGWSVTTPDDMESPFDVGVWRTDLEDAAQALGEPRVLVFGPVLRGAESQHLPDLHGSGVLDPNWVKR